MSDAPSIKGSAQARLILYRLLSTKLTDAELQLITADPSQWEKILLILENMVDAATKTKADQEVLNQSFSHIDKTTRDGLQRQIERLTGQSLWLGIYPTPLLDSFITEHMKLIKSIQREYLDKIGLAIERGIREGRLQKDIIKDIRELTDLSKKRVRLIARNAPLQYSGALTRHHQISAGIKKYRWQTSQDERVRDSHKARNNKIYDWNGSQPYPRSEVNCRCDAIPVMA